MSRLSHSKWLTVSGVLILAVCGNWAVAKDKADRFQPQPRPTPMEQKIEEALDSPAKIDCQELPLKDLVKRLADEHKVPVILDRRALDDAGISSDFPFSYKSSGESLRVALQWMLRDFDLVAVPVHETLQITTVEEAESQLVTRIYPVADLVSDEAYTEFLTGDAGSDSLIEAVTMAVPANRWDNVGGPGSIVPANKCLVVLQTRENHRNIEQFLTALRKMVHPLTEKVLDPPHIILSVSPPSPKITQTLQTATEVDFNEVPLQNALEALEKQHQVRMKIDHRALGDGGISPEEDKVTLNAKDITLASALELLLRDLDLTYIPREFWIEITTAEEADSQVETGIYDVADLIYSAEFPPSLPDYDELSETVTTAVAPTTWDESGHHTISFRNCLIVPQTRAVHAEIAEVLAALRAASRSQEPPADSKVAQLVAYPQLSTMTGMIGLSSEQVADVASAIQRWVEPKSWKSAGGPNVIDIVNSTLLIEAPPQVQKEVGKFLTKLNLMRGDVYGQGGGGLGGGGFGGGGLGGIYRGPGSGGFIMGGQGNGCQCQQGTGEGAGTGANFFDVPRK